MTNAVECSSHRDKDEERAAAADVCMCVKHQLLCLRAGALSAKFVGDKGAREREPGAENRFAAAPGFRCWARGAERACGWSLHLCAYEPVATAEPHG